MRKQVNQTQQSIPVRESTPAFGERADERTNFLCWQHFLILFLPIFIMIIGILLRDTISEWINLPAEILLITILILSILHVLLLKFQKRQKFLHYITWIVLIFVIIFSILLTAILTQSWLDLWVWLTILVLLTAIATIVGCIIGFELVRRCRKPPKIFAKSIRVSSKGLLTVTRAKDKTPPLPPPPIQESHLLNESKIVFKDGREINENRFTGPFIWEEFDQIQILLNLNDVTWYYNDYFKQTSNSLLYARYYKFISSERRHMIPENAVTRGPDDGRPGTQTGPIPEAQGPQGILLTLKSIHYSDQYGGSVKLNFEMDESYYYEFRFDPYLYELSSLQVYIYVVPLVKSFNPSPVKQEDGALSYPLCHAYVFIEYEPIVETSYVQVFPDVDLGDLPIPPRDEDGELVPDWEAPNPITWVKVPDFLSSKALKHLSISLAKWQLNHNKSEGQYGLLWSSNHPTSFVYGWLHALHWNSIPDPVKYIPTRITIGDDFFELMTAEGEFYFNIAFMIENIEAPYDDIIRFKIRAYHDYGGIRGKWYPHEHKFRDLELDNFRNYTRWYTMASFSFSDAQKIYEDKGKIGSSGRDKSNKIKICYDLWSKGGGHSFFLPFLPIVRHGWQEMLSCAQLHPTERLYEYISVFKKENEKSIEDLVLIPAIGTVFDESEDFNYNRGEVKYSVRLRVRLSIRMKD